MNKPLGLLFLTMAIALTACGGSGGSGSSDTPDDSDDNNKYDNRYHH